MDEQFRDLKKKYPGQLLGTHNGKFHLDEVMATAILINIFPDARLLRTRDEYALKQCDIIYDIGGVFNVDTLRFDHHQRYFDETFSSEFDVKLSSAGLVYRHFSDLLLQKYGINPSKEIIKEIYEEYFMHIDAHDNGIDNPMKYRQRGLASIVHDFSQPTLPEDENELSNFFPDLIIPIEYESIEENHEKKQGQQTQNKISETKESIRNIGVTNQNEKQKASSQAEGYNKDQEAIKNAQSNRFVSQLTAQKKHIISQPPERSNFNDSNNPQETNKNVNVDVLAKNDTNNQTNNDNSDGSKGISISYSKRFMMALKFVFRDLNNFLRSKQTFYRQLESCLELVLKCESPIVVVPTDHNISQEGIFTLNRRYNKNIMFVIYETKRGVFRMYAIRKSLDSFESICSLKESWRGLRDSELQCVSGIKTAKFVHASGFTGGASNLNDAIRMCEISLEECDKK